MSWILKFYHWLWHDILHLDKPISWIIVSSIKANLLRWDITGAVVLVITWVLLMHFIAMN